jgi:hypothetical protein
VVDDLVSQERGDPSVVDPVHRVLDNEPLGGQGVEHAGEVAFEVGEDVRLQLARLPLEPAFAIRVTPEHRERLVNGKTRLGAKVPKVRVLADFGLDASNPTAHVSLLISM